MTKKFFRVLMLALSAALFTLPIQAQTPDAMASIAFTPGIVRPGTNVTFYPSVKNTNAEARSYNIMLRLEPRDCGSTINIYTELVNIPAGATHNRTAFWTASADPCGNRNYTVRLIVTSGQPNTVPVEATGQILVNR